jgi:DNA-directed RNA polymerase specialized sigma24 family protein
MPASDLAQRLDGMHQRLLRGSRVASRDLFLLALQPLANFVAQSQPTLRDDESHDIATDAILTYLNDPARCDLGRASLWTYLCMVASSDAIDLFRTRARRADLLRESADDVAEWSRRANHTADVDIEIDARRILEMHGHKLATNDAERQVLTLILTGEKTTAAFAHALGLDPGDGEVVALVKQAKDRMRVRLRRLRDEL